MYQKKREPARLITYFLFRGALIAVVMAVLMAELIGSLSAVASPTSAPKGAQMNKTETVKKETALLAGGCFWGVQDLIRKLPGVITSEVGYTGGITENPTYTQVKTGSTFHAEAVRIEFDASKVTYEKILDLFFRLHDPTTKNQQGNDLGTQYRSSIFYLNDAQKKIAEEKIKSVDASKKWKRPVVTEVVPAKPFYRAEEDHQDYLVKHPNGYTCHYLRD